SSPSPLQFPSQPLVSCLSQRIASTPQPGLFQRVEWLRLEDAKEFRLPRISSSTSQCSSRPSSTAHLSHPDFSKHPGEDSAHAASSSPRNRPGRVPAKPVKSLCS